jgi:hypothetical protein
MGDLLDGWAALEADRALWRVGGVAVLAVPEAWAASTDDIGTLDRRAASVAGCLGGGWAQWREASATQEWSVWSSTGDNLSKLKWATSPSSTSSPGGVAILDEVTLHAFLSCRLTDATRALETGFAENRM